MLINAIATEGNLFLVRFCDLTPRAAADAAAASPRPKPTTTTTTEQSTTITEELTTENFEEEETTTLVPTSPKKIIKIKQSFNTTRQAVTEITTPQPQPETPVVTDSPATDQDPVTQSRPLPTELGTINSQQITLLKPLNGADDSEGNRLPIHGIVSSIAEKGQTAPNGLADIGTFGIVDGDTNDAVETPTADTIVYTENTSPPELATPSIKKAIEVEPANTEITETPEVVSEIPIEEPSEATVELGSEGMTLPVEYLPTEPSTSQISEEDRTSAPTTIEVQNLPEESTTFTEPSEVDVSTTSDITKPANSESETITPTTEELTSTTISPLKPKAQFAAIDIKETETMLPHTSSDYSADDHLTDEEKAEADKLMKSIIDMMEVKEQKVSTETELAEATTVVEAADRLLSETIENARAQHKSAEENHQLSAKDLFKRIHEHDADDSERPHSKKQFKAALGKPRQMIDGNVHRIDLKETQLDEVPVAEEGAAPEEHVVQMREESTNEQSFDFAAFPSPPPDRKQTTTTSPPTAAGRRRPPTATHRPTLPPVNPEVLPSEKPEIPLSGKVNPPRRSFRRHPTNPSPYVDEETNSSPFDFGNPDSAHKQNMRRVDVEGFLDAGSSEQQSGRFSLPERFNQRSPFDPEIRRSPTPRISDTFQPLRTLEKLSARPRNNVDIVFQKPVESLPVVSVLTTAPPAPIPVMTIGHRDGERSFTPADNKPMELPQMAVIPQRKKFVSVQKLSQPTPSVEHLVPMAAVTETPQPSTSEAAPTETTTLPLPSSIAIHRIVSTTSPPAAPTTTTTTAPYEETENIEELETTAEPLPFTENYDPLRFYHTAPPRRRFQKERVLTFCSKESAIRDRNNMVIACGVENDIWTPNRCPVGTDCFISHDSLYRICCPVGSR